MRFSALSCDLSPRHAPQVEISCSKVAYICAGRFGFKMNFLVLLLLVSLSKALPLLCVCWTAIHVLKDDTYHIP